MTLSAVLIALVTSVFLAQNDLYQHVVDRSRVQENARSVAELMASELRPASRGSVTLAESRRLTVRSPQAVGVICDKLGSDVHVHLPLDGQGVDTSDVTGYAIREADETWSFYSDSWSGFYGSQGASSVVASCVAAGMDTTGVSTSDFYELNGPGSDPTPSPNAGGLLMVYREIEYEIKASGLQDGALGLFRGLSGETGVEFATGLNADARFEYRLAGETTFRSSVTGSDLSEIVTVRLVPMASDPEAPPGDSEAYSYGFAVDVPLRNVQ